MRRRYHQWFSPSLHRSMELLEFGHAGAKVIVFPTSQGQFYEWEDRGMIAIMKNAIEHGWFHFFCVSTVDSESWYCRWKHPGARAWRQEEYDQYLLNEVIPLTNASNTHPYTILTGASFGAYHALNFGLRHPHQVQRILSLSGLCDIRLFTDEFSNDTIYFHNPMEYIAQEAEYSRLHALRSQDIILTVGKTDRLLNQNRELSGKLWSKGIGNALREWEGFAHEWETWYQQLPLYLGGHD